tara:strand:- start:1919 stop:2080 length:162 start_codon:yes stop_codon:yes gene_type:complete
MHLGGMATVKIEITIFVDISSELFTGYSIGLSLIVGICTVYFLDSCLCIKAKT